MWKLTVYIYFICIILTYQLLRKRLCMYNKKTNQKIDTDTEGPESIAFKIVTICYSISWIISLPMLYHQTIKEMNKNNK